VAQHVAQAAARAHLSSTDWLNHHFDHYFHLHEVQGGVSGVVAGREHQIERDSSTGRFVDDDYARSNPRTTTHETVHPGEPAGTREAYRDTETGRFVDEGEAKAHPESTQKDHLR
jgi:hypothetical protein